MRPEPRTQACQGEGLSLHIFFTLALSPAGNSSDMAVPTAGDRGQFRHEPGPRTQQL